MSKALKRPLTDRSFKSISTHTDKSVSVTSGMDERTVCKSHPKKQLALYCSFCEMPVCEKCKVITHARHVVDVKGNEALLSAARIRRRYLTRLLDAKQKVVPDIKDTVIQIMESKTKLQQQMEVAIEQYKDYAAMHRDKLCIPEEGWVDDAMFRAARFYQLMDEKIDFLKRRLLDISSTLTLIFDELKDANNPELLLMFGVLRSGLESLYAPRWPREEISVSLTMESVPEFGAVLIQKEEYFVDKNCHIEFNQEITQPIVYSRVYDTKIPVPKRVFQDDHAKMSLSSADEMFVSFGEYIVVYPLDNRRYGKASTNIRFNRIITVRQNIIDIACDQGGDLYFAVHNAIKRVSHTGSKILKSFSLKSIPSAICLSYSMGQRPNIFVGFHDDGKIVKYSTRGEIIMELTHPDQKMVYRPRHLAINYVGDIFFSDDISNITVLDSNGIWKGAIVRDVKSPPASRLLKPTGIACTYQRHVLIIDANAITNIHAFSEDGKYLQTAVFKNLNDAYVLNVDKTDDVWVAFKDGRLRIYRPNFIAQEMV